MKIAESTQQRNPEQISDELNSLDWNMAAQVDRTHPNRHLLQDYTAPAIAC